MCVRVCVCLSVLSSRVSVSHPIPLHLIESLLCPAVASLPCSTKAQKFSFLSIYRFSAAVKHYLTKQNKKEGSVALVHVVEAERDCEIEKRMERERESEREMRGPGAYQQCNRSLLLTSASLPHSVLLHSSDSLFSTQPTKKEKNKNRQKPKPAPSPHLSLLYQL